LRSTGQPGSNSIQLEEVDVTTGANSEVRLRFDNEIADTYRLTSARVSFYFDAPSGTQVADYGLLQHQPIDVGNAFTDVTGLGVILQPDTDDNANAAEDDHDETSLRLQLYAEGIGAIPTSGSNSRGRTSSSREP